MGSHASLVSTTLLLSPGKYWAKIDAYGQHTHKLLLRCYPRYSPHGKAVNWPPAIGAGLQPNSTQLEVHRLEGITRWLGDPLGLACLCYNCDPGDQVHNYDPLQQKYPET